MTEERLRVAELVVGLLTDRDLESEPLGREWRHARTRARRTHPLRGG